VDAADVIEGSIYVFKGAAVDICHFLANLS